MITELSILGVLDVAQSRSIGSTFLVIAVGLILLLLTIPLIRFLKSGLHRIPEGQVAVVERLGRFTRLGGPGLVWVTPRIEEIKHIAHVRLREEQFLIQNLWFRDVVQVDIDLTVCYWLDLLSIETDLLRHVAYRSVDQWRNTLKNRAAPILRDGIARYDLMELIGQDQLCREELEQTFIRELDLELREWGIRLKQPGGAWIRDIGLPTELQESLNNIRRTDIDVKTKSAMVGAIRERYPGLSDLVLLSLFKMIGGQQDQLVHVLPYVTTALSGRDTTLEEISSELGDREVRSLEEPERDDSWRSLKPPPKGSESR